MAVGSYNRHPKEQHYSCPLRITAGDSIRRFEGTVQTLHHLFERAEFLRYLIFIGEADDLGDVKAEVFPIFMEELLGSQGISTVSIRDKPEPFRESSEVPQSHAHGKDTGTNTTVIRDLSTEDGTGDVIYYEPDISFDATDFDISLVGNQGMGGLVVIVIDEGLDDQSCSPGIVGYLLMGDLDSIQVR